MRFTYLKDISILIVEDDKGTRVELSRILKEYTKKVYEASDGEEGLIAYKKYKPDIILTDIRMPNMDGLTLSEKIKEIDKETIIVVTTAYSDDFNLMQSIEIGVNSFVNKPVAPFKLLKNLNLFAKSILIEKREREKENLFLENILLNAKSEILHDIVLNWKQPLSTINSQIENMEDKLNNESINTEFVKENLNSMKKEIEKIFKAMNSFSNLYSKENKDKKRVKLIDLINNTLEILNYILEDANVKINLNIDENFEIEVNEKKFIQSIISIIKNSIEAKENNSIKRVIITIKSLKNRDGFNLEIIDNCGGIKEDIIDKVFEPYFKTKFKTQGVGVNLFFVKNFFETDLNANMKLENFGSGVKVTITFPLENIDFN